VGPWIGGYLFDLSGSYTSSFILSMVSMGLSCISLWLAAPRKTTMS
jgi:cyanate permease